MQTNKGANLSSFIYNVLIFPAFIAVCTLPSCKQKSKQEILKKKSPSFIEATISTAQADSIALFDLEIETIADGDTVAFISVSDIDALPGNIDSPVDSVNRLVLPSFDGKSAEETEHINLASPFRERLLNGTRISEHDSLFVYNYSSDKLFSFPIKSLDAVAYLTPYGAPEEPLRAATDYRFGFKIDHEKLKTVNGYAYNNTFAYIGKANPFTKGQMRPIVWEQTAAKNMPTIAMQKGHVELLKDYKLKNTYTFKFEELKFYIQIYNQKSDPGPAYRLLILNSKNEVLYNELCYPDEGSMPASLSFVNNKNVNYYQQWVGRLLKNRPPIIFGFVDTGFSCDILPYMDKSGGYIVLACDNRH